MDRPSPPARRGTNGAGTINPGELLAADNTGPQTIHWLAYTTDQDGDTAACYIDHSLLRHTHTGRWWRTGKNEQKVDVPPHLIARAIACMPDTLPIWPGQAALLPTTNGNHPDNADPDGPPLFTIESVADIAHRVDRLPPVGWLAKPVWPADAYGVSAAEKKAGKTWLLLDLAVSVASGTPWLGIYDCPTPGPVLLFLGEGGERKMLRRLRAIGDDRGIDVEQLPIRMSFRVPRLSSETHLALVAAELADNPAHLVGVDPLYLAAAGAKSSDLYAMGAVLQGVQLLCQHAGAALMVVTHWNKTGIGTGSERMTGVGPAEWGRVLVSAEVQHRHTETDRSTAVTLRIAFEGDEIPETEQRIRRRIGTEDPDDLASPMHYHTETLEPEQNGTNDGLRPAAQRILNVLHQDGGWLDLHQIGDLLATDDTGMKPLKARTIQDGCKTLVTTGHLRTAEIPGTNALKWTEVTHEPTSATTERAQPPQNNNKNWF